MSTETHPITPPPVAGARGARNVRGNSDRDEQIQVLDPTPPSPIDPTLLPKAAPRAVVGSPGQLEVQPPSNEVVGSALAATPAPASNEPPAKVEYYRYIGDKDRRFKMAAGAGRDGFMATMRPGKVITTKDYSLANLRAQGFIPGRNLEEISEEEAKAN